MSNRICEQLVMVEPMIDHAGLRQRIRQCQHIDQFKQVYHSAAFQRTICTIRDARVRAPVDERSKNWVLCMCVEILDNADVELSECRHTAMNFVYELCNRWKNDEHQVLPMDRAQALYKMMYPGEAALDMRGASEACAEQSNGPTTPSERPFWSTVDGEEQIEAALAKIRRYLSATARDGTIDGGLTLR